MKIAVYTITKNEEQFISRWAESCKEADYRLIVDTGSTDNTVNIAIENGCYVETITVSPWRFDDARNAALALLPDDIDMCVSLDADEILMPGWREHLEALPSNITRPRYKYVWSWNADGTEGLTFLRDHIHKRHGYRWRHPVHEILVCTGNEVQAWCPLEVHHHPDSSKSRSQYLPLLELAVREDPTGDRNMFYYGRELMFNGMNDEAVKYLLKHIEISTWDAERSASMRYLGKLTPDSEKWFLRACAEAPNRREPWVDLAKFYYENQKWAQCYGAVESALSIKDKPLDYICEAEPWGSYPYDIGCIAAWNLGFKQRAIDLSTEAYKMSPYDNRIRLNLATMYRISRTSRVDVIIPTKSNIDGISKLIENIGNDFAIDNIIIVADGSEAKQKLDTLFPFTDTINSDSRIKILEVPLSSGIHFMWNTALDILNKNNHVLFINDDIEIEKETASTLAGLLDLNQQIGLISPIYDNRQLNEVIFKVSGANGVYGKTGISGACMMLASSLVKEWKFDEEMKWYFGDDDVAHWVEHIKKMNVCLTPIAKSWGNCSWTTENDPPKNFKKITENDKKIFDAKWAIIT